jgi:hypothetical protein
MPADAESTNDEALFAARTALVVLLGLAVSSVTMRDYVFQLPGSIGQPIERMVQHLAALPKPIECVSFNYIGLLTVGTWPAVRGSRIAQTEGVAEAMTRSTIAALVGGESQLDTSPIFVTAGKEAIRLTYTQLRAFQADYWFPIAHRSIGRVKEHPARTALRSLYGASAKDSAVDYHLSDGSHTPTMHEIRSGDAL